MVKKICFNKFTEFSTSHNLNQCKYWMIDKNAFFVKLTSHLAFSVFFHTLQVCVTDILKMCMKKFIDEKIIFDK